MLVYCRVAPRGSSALISRLFCVRFGIAIVRVKPQSVRTSASDVISPWMWVGIKFGVGCGISIFLSDQHCLNHLQTTVCAAEIIMVKREVLEMRKAVRLVSWGLSNLLKQ